MSWHPLHQRCNEADLAWSLVAALALHALTRVVRRL